MASLHQLSISAVAGLSVVLAAAPALAQAQEQEIVITAKQLPNGFEPVTQVVKIADLNRGTSAGVTEMEKRVTGAVDTMCDTKGSAGVLPANERKTCRDFAWASARPQMDRAVNAATQKP